MKEMVSLESAAARIYELADQLKFSNKMKEAEQNYRMVTKLVNDDIFYFHLAQGQIHDIHDNIDDSLVAFEIARSLEISDVRVHINIGINYRKLAGRCRTQGLFNRADQMLQESIDALNQAQRLDQNNTGVLSAQAMTYLMMGDKNLSKVKTCAEKILSLDPENYDGLTTLAQVLQTTGKNSEARKLVLKAVELKPELPFGYSMLGMRRQRNKMPLEPKPINAIKWLNLAIEKGGFNAFVYDQMAKAHTELHDYEQALVWYDKIIAAGGAKKSYLAYANRGNLFFLMNNLRSAEADLKISLAIHPENAFAQVAWRNVTEKSNRLDEALNMAQKVVTNSNDNNRDKNQKILDRIEKQFKSNMTESIRITRKMTADRVDIKTYENYCLTRKALKLYPKNHEAWGFLGRYYLEHKEYPKAKKYLQDSLKANPKNFFLRNQLGSLLENIGDLIGARRAYQTTISQRPQDGYALNRLKVIEEKLATRPSVRKDRFNLFTGPKIIFFNRQTGREEIHSVDVIRQFLQDRINDWNLPIKAIIDQVGDRPVFIIAKTGVGKTVTVPTKVLLGLIDDLIKSSKKEFRGKEVPKVYVVEPRIPICTMTMAEMNDGYQNYLAYRMIGYRDCQEYLKKCGLVSLNDKSRENVSAITKHVMEFVKTGNAPYNPQHFNLYGCITSATGKINASAPILFVTTGIMESLTFDGNELDPQYHRIVIDEAHVTIEQNPAIELGIALARKIGVKIDYMSATVDQATLAEDLEVNVVYAGTQRFPIHLTNLGTSVHEKITDLVENLLIEPDPNRLPHPKNFHDLDQQARVARVRRHLLAKEDYTDEGRTYQGLNNRAQGLLIIVNSHQSESADTKVLSDLIAKAEFQKKTKVHTLRLASPVVRDPSQKLAFDRLIHKIEREKGRYVIVATNVVEMGLTFSSLDYVVTMDSEFDNEFEDGAVLVKKVQLGVNALYQRIGRCGRVRPGMAFIAKDYGADYTVLSDQDLARGLPEAPIRYPLSKGSFQKLALYSFRENISDQDLQQSISSLKLPSRIEHNQVLWQHFRAERDRLRRIGIADQQSLTAKGKMALSFVGLDDLYFAGLLSDVIIEHGSGSDLAIIFTLFAAANEYNFVGGRGAIMQRDFVMDKPDRLCASCLIGEEVLNLPLSQLSEIVSQYECEVESLFDELTERGVDSQIAGQICHLIRSGYKLVESKQTIVDELLEHATLADEIKTLEASQPVPNPDDIMKDKAVNQVSGGGFWGLLKRGFGSLFGAPPTLPVENTSSGRYSIKAPVAANRDQIIKLLPVESSPVSQNTDIKEEDDGINLEKLEAELGKFQGNKAIVFEKTAVSLSRYSDLINIWRVFNYFYTNYWSKMRSRRLNSLEESEYHRAIRMEADRLQVNLSNLQKIHKGFLDLIKRIGVILPRVTERIEDNYQLNEDDKELLQEVCLTEFLFARLGDDDKYELCAQIYQSTDELSGRINYREIANQLCAKGLKTDFQQVKELFNLIVKPAREKYCAQLREFEVESETEILPVLTIKMENQILRYLRQKGYHQKLFLTRRDLVYEVQVTDQTGQTISVIIDPEKSPLTGAFQEYERSGKDKVPVYAKLTPVLRQITQHNQGDVSQGDFITVSEKGFDISLITVI